MSQAKVRVEKDSSINPIQSGEAEGRAKTINTTLALVVMQGGYLRFIEVMTLDMAKNKIAKTSYHLACFMKSTS